MQTALSQDLQNLINNRLRYLPPVVGEAMNSIDWPTKIIDIGRTFGMHMDEMEDFQTVVAKALVGLTDPAHFEQELIANLALSPANVEKVIAALNQQILEPIHDYVTHGKPSGDILAKTGINLEPQTEHTDTSPNLATAPLTAGTTEIDLGNTLEPKISLREPKTEQVTPQVAEPAPSSVSAQDSDSDDAAIPDQEILNNPEYFFGDE